MTGWAPINVKCCRGLGHAKHVFEDVHAVTTKNDGLETGSPPVRLHCRRPTRTWIVEAVEFSRPLNPRYHLFDGASRCGSK